MLKQIIVALFALFALSFVGCTAETGDTTGASGDLRVCPYFVPYCPPECHLVGQCPQQCHCPGGATLCGSTHCTGQETCCPPSMTDGGTADYTCVPQGALCP